MTGGSPGPTRGAYEQPADHRWEASPRLALLIRVAVFASPLLGALGGLLLVSHLLLRPPGWFGLLVWFAQGLIVSTAISMSIERVARQLLPLASLFTMSLIFPDQAPSRFGVALRSGTVRRLKTRAVDGAPAPDLGDDVGAAAVKAVEYITALANHDRLTRGHTERVRAYADLIAKQMGLSDGDREKLTWGVMLHDIGKMAVPGEILNKSGTLTDEEWALLKRHPTEGERLLAPLRDWLGPWALAASEHHERWDGAGYPRGLRGSQISLAGRITAVADAYDVITSKRSYKEPMSATAARRELVSCAGTQFDSDVVRAFINVSLGRRWSAGVLASLTHLPIGNLGSAPAAISVGMAITAGAMVAGSPPNEPIEALAFYDTPSTTIGETVDEPIGETEGPTPTSASFTVTVPSSEGPTSSTDPTSTDEVTTSTEPAGDATTSTSLAGSTTTRRTTTAAPPPPTTTTTAAPTTTTTTVPPPTVPPPTVAPPTTPPPTVPPTPPSVYYLQNPGPDDQDTSAQVFKQLTTVAPDDASQHNFDTNRDAQPGLGFDPTTNGWGENDTAKVARFFLDPDSGSIGGTLTLHLWAATESNGTTAPVRVSVADCRTVLFVVSCNAPLADMTLSTSTWVANGFQELVYTLTSPAHSFGSDRQFVLRVITEGSQRVHLAFDSTVYPSRIEFTLS